MMQLFCKIKAHEPFNNERGKMYRVRLYRWKLYIALKGDSQKRNKE